MSLLSRCNVLRTNDPARCQAPQFLSIDHTCAEEKKSWFTVHSCCWACHTVTRRRNDLIFVQDRQLITWNLFQQPILGMQILVLLNNVSFEGIRLWRDQRDIFFPKAGPLDPWRNNNSRQQQLASSPPTPCTRCECSAGSAGNSVHESRKKFLWNSTSDCYFSLSLMTIPINFWNSGRI